MQFLLTILATATLAAVIVLIVLVARRGKTAVTSIPPGTIVSVVPSGSPVPTVVPLLTTVPEDVD